VCAHTHEWRACAWGTDDKLKRKLELVVALLWFKLSKQGRPTTTLQFTRNEFTPARAFDEFE
jgi:hypothetical protein